jgi:predicted Rossmann-fold nucleotide-binding protein
MGMGWRSSPSTRVRKKKPKKLAMVALVGGSLPFTGVVWADLVTAVASEFVDRDIGVLWCGMGTGLAGAIATEVLARGGKATAVVVKGDKPPAMPKGAEVVKVADLYARTGKLLELSTGCLVVPGGAGTLMELTTFAAFRNVGLYAHPVVVLNADGWANGVLKTLNEMADEGAIELHATMVHPCKTARASFAALVDPDTEKVRPRKRVSAVTRTKMRAELVRRGRKATRVFRALTVPEKIEALASPKRSPAIPAFVIQIGGPSKEVRELALKDEDADVRAAAAEPARPIMHDE